MDEAYIEGKWACVLLIGIGSEEFICGIILLFKGELELVQHIESMIVLHGKHL